MENKKIIILIILAVFAVISLIYGIAAPSKVKAVKSAVSQRLDSPKEVSVVKTMPSYDRHFKRSKFTSWNRNPFVPVETAAPVQNLVLSGIIWDKNKPKAMIGDMIVGKGEEVSGNKVIDIKPDKVILNDGKRNFELKIEK